MELTKLKKAASNIETSDLRDVEIGEEIESLGIVFTVKRFKPLNSGRHLCAVELSYDNYIWVYSPVKISDYETNHVSYEEWIPKKKRKDKNEQRDTEIYEKSKTLSSKELAEEYEMTYAMIRYIIRKMSKLS